MSKNIITALPELIDEGILPVETAEKIRAYYRHKEHQQPDRMTVVFGILGSLLVGLGIILIVAHNWDEIDKPVKLLLSFAPVFLGQLFCGYVLLKKQHTPAWKESAATFLFFAVGACIALVAQVYHIPGNLGSFLFTWMLLCFPLIYIMPSSLASLLYIGGVTVFAVQDGYGFGAVDSYHYWWLILIAFPHYLLLCVKRPAGNFTSYHHFLVPLSLTICLGTLAGSNGQYMTIAYMSLFGAFYLVGTLYKFSSTERFPGVYLVFGIVGTIGILLALSFREFWTKLADHPVVLSIPEWLAVIVTTLVALSFLILQLKKRRNNAQTLLSFVFLFFIVIFFTGMFAPMLGTILINMLVLAIGIFTIRLGHAMNHLAVLNYGLGIVAALVTCRFFDTDLSFVVRGLLFIAVGAGFFFANSRLMKRRKQLEQ
jgi:uncharacterized membrane protein